ncbi:CPBP family intramembrane metalloprotease [Ruania alkalisoli]|uniref:CPBP family intramembrane metalloprotease n=1 Tax=Ruania alkalisoli TaxID=2779775 RepID=A0A7M1SSZ4_9MICO|nr:CPBP family intramembrane glutamic endopeptidase [Ruania alkalisoli]QOR70615.1 CPBP family intramembrane metalloprotease [Ruania alkalisoli]
MDSARAASHRPATAPPTVRARSRRLTAEIWIVLGLSLGKSAVYAIVAIIAALTRGPLGEQTTALNTSQSPRPYLDLTYQVLSVAFALVPVALVLYLLSESGRSAFRRIGLDLRRPVRDLGWGLALGALIGIPGLGLYLAGRALGITVAVQASGLDPYWWTVPVLLLAALKNALVEEVIVVGYLIERLGEKRWGLPAIVATSALLRGAYHLYQGWGPFAANAIMGVTFALFYLSRFGRRRVMPLVVAHTVLDVVAFVGYQYLPEAWLAALGVDV